jgi:hypothetical protein
MSGGAQFNMWILKRTLKNIGTGPNEFPRPLIEAKRETLTPLSPDVTLPTC